MTAELFTDWWSLMGQGLVVALVGFALFAGLQALRRYLSLEVTWIAYGIALAVGLGRVAYDRNLLDRAFIHFRHASNTVAGEGPVFNAGEYVEGVSALGWTLLLATGGAIGVSIPTWSVILTVCGYVALSALALRIGQGLWERDPEQTYLPFAAMLLCVQGTITPFGTSGMETAVLAACILAAGGGLAANRPVQAGLFAALATVIRPDHGVFWLAAMASTRRRDDLARVLVPGLALLLPFAAFKLWFYGSLIPNPFYALGANQLPVGDGLEHLILFVVGEHLWLVGLLFAGWWWSGEVSDDEARFRRFATIGIGLHVVAVTAMGASTNYGQLYLTDMALLVLGAEALCHRRTRLPQWAAAGLLGATLGGLTMIPPASHRGAIAETHTFFRLQGLSPLRVDHHTQQLGRLFGMVRNRGGQVTIATCCGIGVIGYTSGVEAIHTRGLTDRHFARTKNEEDWDYLREREVDFVRDSWAERPYRSLTAVSFKGMENVDGRWFLLRYDRERMAEVRKYAKSIRVLDVEAHLDTYLQELDRKAPERVKADLAFFDAYYFDVNDDEARRAPIAERARAAP